VSNIDSSLCKDYSSLCLVDVCIDWDLRFLFVVKVTQLRQMAGHIVPVILILLFRSSVEVAGSSCIVQHGEVSQVWETGGDSLDKNGEVSDLVFVHPQDL